VLRALRSLAPRAKPGSEGVSFSQCGEARIVRWLLEILRVGQPIREVRSLDVVTPASIQAEHFTDGLHFVSLDVEGLELEILRAFDLDARRPEVFCIEREERF
jgi:hypothetical protein